VSMNPPAWLGEDAPVWLCLTALNFTTQDATGMRDSDSIAKYESAHPRRRARRVNLPPIPEGYTTIDSAAKASGISAGALWYYVTQGYIPSVKIDKHRFVKLEDVMRYKAQKDAEL